MRIRNEELSGLFTNRYRCDLNAGHDRSVRLPQQGHREATRTPCEALLRVLLQDYA